MKISVLGFGNVGAQLTRLWIGSGHTLTVGLRKGSEHEQEATQLGAEVVEPQLAARSGDAVVLALPWAAVQPALTSIGTLNGKILVDATNPLKADLSVLMLESGSGGQQVAQWSGARVVKAFNTIGAQLFGDPAFDALYCGDDAAAKEVVRGLIADTTMHPVDVGPLSNAVYLEHIAGLWIDLAMKGRVQGAFGFNLIKKDSNS